jgi:hypothetical protein
MTFGKKVALFCVGTVVLLLYGPAVLLGTSVALYRVSESVTEWVLRHPLHIEVIAGMLWFAWWLDEASEKLSAWVRYQLPYKCQTAMNSWIDRDLERRWRRHNQLVERSNRLHAQGKWIRARFVFWRAIRSL